MHAYPLICTNTQGGKGTMTLNMPAARLKLSATTTAAAAAAVSGHNAPTPGAIKVRHFLNQLKNIL